MTDDLRGYDAWLTAAPDMPSVEDLTWRCPTCGEELDECGSCDAMVCGKCDDDHVCREDDN